MNFSKCLEFGKKYEKETLKYIKYDTTEFSEGKFKEWDIKTTKNDITTYYEVKADLQAYKYGNLCIEYECSGKKSGITATTADYWFYYIIKDKDKNEYDVYNIPTQKIKDTITKKQFKRIVKCGDNNNASCYLLSKEIFREYLL